MNTPETLIEIKDLKKYFPLTRGLLARKTTLVKAVDGIDLKILRGETLGLVGESGCGKSTLGRTILRLYKPTGGQILFEGKDHRALGKNKLKRLRREMQVIFQDPYSCLNPRKSVGRIIGEPFIIHKICNEKERRDRVMHLLELVGLNADHYARLPHQFSGGQRQRIGIARALALNPKFIVCDEPVAALDVSIQAQIINLLRELQLKYNLTYLFIAHNLSIVEYTSDRVAVMYLGRIVELAESVELHRRPLHPYTQALFSASPVAGLNSGKERIMLSGEVPSPISPPAGCHFHTRCAHATERCRAGSPPPLIEIKPGHFVRCSRTDAMQIGQIRI